MRISVLSVPGCPHADLALERVVAAVGDRPDVVVDTVAVADEASAQELGMHGSPTILVDGTDHFALPEEPCIYACRYDPSGDPVPSVEQLREAVGSA